MPLHRLPGLATTPKNLAAPCVRAVCLPMPVPVPACVLASMHTEHAFVCVPSHLHVHGQDLQAIRVTVNKGQHRDLQCELQLAQEQPGHNMAGNRAQAALKGVCACAERQGGREGPTAPQVPSTQLNHSDAHYRNSFTLLVRAGPPGALLPPGPWPPHTPSVLTAAEPACTCKKGIVVCYEQGKDRGSCKRAHSTYRGPPPTMCVQKAQLACMSCLATRHTLDVRHSVWCGL